MVDAQPSALAEVQGAEAQMNTFEVTLEKLVYGGEALGRLPDGRAVFVPYALPGERVRIKLVEEKRGYARAALEEVLEPAADRLSPRCPHFAVCGGCHYQHMTYPAQVIAKQAIVRDQLQRIARLPDPNVRPTVAAPQAWHYRNHVQFHLTAGGVLGFQAPRSHQVVAVQECHLPEAEINAVWPLLDIAPVPGLERVALRQGTDGEVLLMLESTDPHPAEFAVDFPLSAVHLGPEGPVLLAGEDFVVIEVLGRPFRVSAGAFFQVNTAMAARLVEHLLEHLPLEPQHTVLDLYCGVGLFSAFLAERVAQVIGVEAAPIAWDDFEVNLDEFDNVALYQGAVEAVLPHLDVRPDVVVIDPPRAGMTREVRQALIAMCPPHIAYVSCDPSTLARDARYLLEAGYRLRQITPFDLFPQTYHVETVSLWTLP